MKGRRGRSSLQHMPCSGPAARQLIREPSSCPAFQAASSSYPVPGVGWEGKGRGMGPETSLQAVGHGWSGLVQKGTLRKESEVGGAGWEEEGRRGG